MQPNRYFVVIMLLHCCCLLHGQERYGLITLDAEIQYRYEFPDTALAVPGSLTAIFLNTLDTLSPQHYSYNSHVFRLHDSLPEKQWLRLQYVKLPYILSTTYRHKSTDMIGFDFESFSPDAGYIPPGYDRAATELSNLNYSGSFVRGVSFGNNQNLVLNSSFNLQLNGMISDDISVLASITDNNIPIQPEGNTQQLQDFDKIFIQLQRVETILLAGDYELTDPTGYFLRHYKKMQGLQLRHKFEFERDRSLSITGSIALARGRFTANNIAGVEGNQGPYRLTGAEGEKFIIVLAGTEKVFIDDKLMTRGQQHDYIIDYNRGEITFMSSRLITAFTRIRVEFEYTEQAYLRTSYGLNAEYRSRKLLVYGNLFGEQDNKNSPGVQELSPAQRQMLANLGDQASDAFVSGVDTLEGGFNAERIMYRLADTTVAGQVFENILIYSTDPENAIYVARFSDVGEGNGHYVRSSTQANGAVFAWIAPDSITGAARGRYEPIQKLIPPSRQRMLTSGAVWSPDARTEIAVELAVSDFDKNTFSDLDAEDNTGYTLTTRWRRDIIQRTDTASTRFVLSWDGAYEYVDRNFKAVNPFRDRAFARQWTLRQEFGQDFHWIRSGLSLGFGEAVNLRYQLNGLVFGQNFEGIMHEWNASFISGGFEAESRGTLLQARDAGVENDMINAFAGISQQINALGNLRIGALAEHEKISLRDSLDLNLMETSFYFDRVEFFADRELSTTSNYRVSYGRRWDYAPVADDFVTASVADEAKARWQWSPISAYTLQLQGQYRNLQVSNEEYLKTPSAQTFIGRVEQQFNIRRGLVRGNIAYELGAGQEPKFEFNYIQVNPGEGIYIWIDRNGDEIKQVDEFEIGPYPDEADHIRVVILTDEFVPVRQMQWSQSITINPANTFRGNRLIDKAMQKVMLQSSFQLNRKIQPTPGVLAWNPLEQDIPDSVLVSSTANQRHILHLNRNSTKYGGELGYSRSNAAMLLSTGLEQRTRQEPFAMLRLALIESFSFIAYIAGNSKSQFTEQTPDRNYDIRGAHLKPELNWQITRNMRLNTAYTYEMLENNASFGGESSLKHEASMEYQFNQPAKSSLRTKFTFAIIDFDGQSNTPVEFAMLEGLRPGNNYLWSIAYDRTLARNIMLSLGYEGRQTGIGPLVHIGRAQVRATF